MSLDRSTLNAKGRAEGGKGPARRLRQTGLIPAVIYGRGSAPVPLSVDPEALRKAIATPHKFNTVITVKLDGQPDKLVLLKDYQQHPVSREVLHADFQEVRLDQPVKVEVPVVLTGKAVGVTEGGILSQIARAMEIICLPGAIPEKLEVDVSPLKIGQSLHSDDMTFPEGIKRAARKNETIAVVTAPVEEAAPTAAAVAAPVAGAAPAAAAPAGGKAPAAGGAAPAAGKGAAPAAGGKAPAAPAKK